MQPPFLLFLVFFRVANEWNGFEIKMNFNFLENIFATVLVSVHNSWQLKKGYVRIRPSIMFSWCYLAVMGKTVRHEIKKDYFSHGWTSPLLQQEQLFTRQLEWWRPSCLVINFVFFVSSIVHPFFAPLSLFLIILVCIVSQPCIHAGMF